jgi:UDP-2,3-diacylglucosamine pyrophosphatase LpxH
MSLTFVSDLHLGAQRSAGTTPTTAYQLRLDLLQQFGHLLSLIDTDLCIGGDLFDGPDISKQDLLQAYQCLDDWLVRTGKDLFAMNGNHDLAKSTTNFSAFQFLMALLQANEERYAGGVHHITEGTLTPHGYMLPHLANQELFNLAMAAVPPCDYLFVHCNYDNKFAVESDHSLNMSEEQAKAAPVQHIIFAHEHKARRALAGKVLVVGNQFPSSVSDCLEIVFKRMLVIENGEPQFVETWRAEGDYQELPWGELKDTGARFIRVTGEATAAEAAAVVTAISRFRAVSKALVITNAVKIEGLNDGAALELSHEEITSFSVLNALRPLLDESENKKVTALLEKHNAA